MSGIGTDIDAGLAGFGEVAAARIGPDNDGEADRLGLFRQLADLLDHLELIVGAGVDGEADGGAAETQGIVHTAVDRLVLAGSVAVGAIDLEDRWDGAGEAVGTGFQQPQGCGKGVQTGIDGELIVIVRIVGRRVGREGAVGPVLEALVDRQDDQPAAAAELAVHQDAGELCLGAGAVAFVVGEDALDALRDLHWATPGFETLLAGS